MEGISKSCPTESCINLYPGGMVKGSWFPSIEVVDVGILVLRLKAGSCESHGDWPIVECPDWIHGGEKCLADGSSAQAIPVPFAEPYKNYKHMFYTFISYRNRFTTRF